MYWAFILGVSMLLSALIIGAVNEMFALQKADNPVTVTIPENTTISETAAILKDADVISHPLLFRMFFSMTSDGASIKAGKYETNSNNDYRGLVRMITRRSSARETVRVTIPEGYEPVSYTHLDVYKRQVYMARDDETLRAILNTSDLAVADGIGVCLLYTSRPQTSCGRPPQPNASATMR